MKDYFLHNFLAEFEKKWNTLTSLECRELRSSLDARIQMLEQVPHHPEKPIEELNLSPRSYNVLKAQKLHTVGDILAFGLDNIILLRNAGDKTIQEIKAVLI